MKRVCIALGIITLFAATAHAQMRITEWAYNGLNGEFVEFTNIGSSAIDMTGWSFDDASRTAGSFSLSAFSTVAPGESVILTDNASADGFRTAWTLSALIKVIAGNNQNLGRADEINLYDSSSVLVDRLTFDDQTISGCPRTQNVSGNPISPSVLGANTAGGGNWVLSASGDAFGSHVSAAGDIGNPGHYAVPEPTSLVLVLVAFVGLIAVRRRWA